MLTNGLESLKSFLKISKNWQNIGHHGDNICSA
jgi:hypothetical protein